MYPQIKKTLKAAIFLLFAGLFLLKPARAQTDSLLTLSACIDSVQKYSFLLKAGEYRTEAARQNVRISHSYIRPMVSGELAREDRFLQPYNFNQQWALVHSEWSPGDFFKRTDRVAQQDMLTVQLENEKIRLDGIGRISSLYMCILQKQNELKLLNNQLSLLLAHLNIVQSLWKAGLRSQVDILQTESEISVLRENITRTEMDHENLREELARLIGLPGDKRFQLAKIPTQLLVQESGIPTIREKDLNTNPALQIFVSKIKSQNLQTRLVNAKQWPHLFLGGGYFADGDPTGDGNYWQINTGIAIPIYRGGTIKYQKQESEAISYSLQSEMGNIHRELIIHLEKITDRLRKLKELLALQKDRLQNAQKALSLAAGNYRAGLITNLEFLSLQKQVISTQLIIEKTRLDYIMNLIEFNLSTNQVNKIKMMDKITNNSNTG